MIRLRIELADGEIHRTFRMNTVVIGRSGKSDLSVPRTKGLSRFHCRLVLRDGRCMIEDLGSRNRSRLNGQAVETAEIHAGDLLRLGTLNVHVESILDSEPTEELVHPCLHCGHLYSAGRDGCPRCGTAVRTRTKTRSIGELAFPGYRLVRKIGSGGMGIVFEAHDLAAERRVALKVLRPYLARDLGYVSRFIEETRLLTSLQHPGIVQVFGRGKAGDLHYLTMELVDGRSARELLRDEGMVPWRQAVRIAWEAAKALNAAHQQAGVVHGDVKPANFLVDLGGRVKLCDFGLAAVDLKRQPSRRQDREENRRGTAAYAAPERFSGDGKPTVKSDIYGLGVSLFQLVTGKLPFQGLTVADLRDSHHREPVPPLLAPPHEINPAVAIVVGQMMSKDPMDRPKDYPALIEDLSLLL